MHKMLPKLILIFIFILAPKPYTSYAGNVTIDKSQWEQERNGYNFKKPKEQKRETKNFDPIDIKPITISPLLKWGAIILGIGFLLFLLIKALGLDKWSNYNRRNTGAKRE